MRILVNGMAPDKLGGLEIYLINMNHYMSEDCIFDYIFESKSTIHEEVIKEKGGNIFFITRKRRLLRNIYDWNKILKSQKNISGIVYFNMVLLAWIVPIFICYLHGYKIIVHSHNSDLYNCGLLMRILHKFNKKLLKLCKIKRLTNSKLSSAFLYGDPEAGEMIYNAIDPEHFKFNAEIRDNIRKLYGLEGKAVFGFAGRIAYEKNLLFLINIFNEIIKINNNAVLMIAGEGKFMPEVKTKVIECGIEESVLLLGNCKNIQEIYQAMDVFILPSRFEGLGMALIEAQASGLPCLTSAGVVPPEAKATELLKYVALNNNPKEWAQEAINVYNSDTYSRQYGFEKIKDSNFDIKREALRLEKILSDYAQN